MATGFGIVALSSKLHTLTNQAISNDIVKVESSPLPPFSPLPLFSLI
jgi:hypothetical protein